VAENLAKYMDSYEKLLGDNLFIYGNGKDIPFISLILFVIIVLSFVDYIEITIADLHILPQLAKFQAGFIDYIPTDCLNKWPKVIAYMERVRAIPEIAAYYAKK
jgi:hypothetical protein